MPSFVNAKSSEENKALVVRCGCGKVFENADAYFQHGKSCGTQSQKRKVTSAPPSSLQRPLELLTTASASPSASKNLICWCGRGFKNQRGLQQHGRFCAVYKQQANAQPVYAVSELRSNTVLDAPMPFPVVPYMASVPPPPALLSGIVTASVSVPSAFAPNTCKHALEIEQNSDLDRLTSLHHETQHADNVQNQDEINQQWGDALVSSFASLNLQPASNHSGPSQPIWTCECGCKFTSRHALQQHAWNNRRHVRSDANQNQHQYQNQKFSTTRPLYYKDEDLAELAIMHAQQDVARPYDQNGDAVAGITAVQARLHMDGSRKKYFKTARPQYQRDEDLAELAAMHARQCYSEKQ